MATETENTQPRQSVRPVADASERLNESLESIKKANERVANGFDKMAATTKAKKSHTMTIVAVGTPVGFAAGWLIADQALPKATTTEKMGAGALVSVVIVTASLAVAEQLRNRDIDKENGEKKEEKKSSN